MGIGRSIRLFAGAACGFDWALAAAVSADAFVSYPEPTNLGPQFESVGRPSLAIGADGTRFAAWEANYQGDSPSWFSRSEPGQPFDPLGQAMSSPTYNHAAAVAPDGTVTYARLEYTGSGADRVIRADQIAPDGTPVSCCTLTPDDEDPFDPRVVVDSQGKFTVAWGNGMPDGSIEVQYAQFGSGGSGYVDGVLSQPGDRAYDVELSVDGSDRVTAAWLKETANIDSRVQTRRILANGTLQPRSFVSPVHELFLDLNVASESDGDRIYSWLASDGSEQRVWSRRLFVNGAADPIRAISQQDQVAVQSDLAVGPGDEPVIVWSSAGADNYRVRARSLDASGVPGPAHNISEAGSDANHPAVAIAADGKVHVAWDQYDAGVRHVRATRLTAAGEADTISTLALGGRASSNPDIVVDATGRPTVVATALAPNGSDRIIHARASIVAPETTITSGPADGSVTDDDTPTFEFTSDADSATFACSLDAAPFTACSPPTTLPAQAEGPHSFRVRATDQDGTDATPAEVDFTYDPDADPPDTRVEGREVKAPEKQKQKGKKIRISLKAGADEDVTLTVTGTVDPKGKKKPITLQKLKDKAVDGGDLRKLNLEPHKSKDEKALVKSLKKDGAAKAKVKVVLEDAAGNDTSKSVVVKVKAG